MADLKVALEDLQTEASGPQAPQRHPRIAARKLALIAALAAAAVAAVTVLPGVLRHSQEGSGLRTVKFTITPAQLMRGGDGEIDADVSISRNGAHIAYVQTQGSQLWIRDLDQEQARPVPGATKVYRTFWSPDDQWIGYSRGRVLSRWRRLRPDEDPGAGRDARGADEDAWPVPARLLEFGRADDSLFRLYRAVHRSRARRDAHPHPGAPAP